MKRYSNLYSTICNMDNLRLAYQNAKRGKGWYREVKMIEHDPDKYLRELQEMLVNKTYKTSAYEIFYKNEGKRRKIYKFPFYPDRIAQWAIIQVIEPYLLKKMIADTYSALPERGIHYGLNRVRKAIQTSGYPYCLKLDVRHFYQSINHERLKQKYRRIFKDGDLLWALDEIIDSINTADEADKWEGEEATGIPIGNYVSQYSGNIYLSDFDHWIKEVKHEPYYFRYMDDIVILGQTKEHLRELLGEIKEFMSKEKLKLKPNYQIFPVAVRGVDYLGYRIFPTFTLLRKSTCQRFKRTMLRIARKCETSLMDYHDFCAINSYNGWLVHCNSYYLRNKYLNPLQSHADLYYNVIIKERRSITNDSVSEYTCCRQTA